MNPFIELARDPIHFFTIIGYIAFMIAITILGTTYSIRSLTSLYLEWQNTKHQSQWWGGWIPPARWAAQCAGAVFVLALVLWSLGALVWILGI